MNTQQSRYLAGDGIRANPDTRCPATHTVAFTDGPNTASVTGGRKRLPAALAAMLLAVSMTQIGCSHKDGDEYGEPVVKKCKASVIFEEVIVIRETDAAPINDKWDIEAQVLPQFPPNAGAFTKIANGVVGNQGVRLVRNFVFGPKILGPKDQRYNISVLVKAKELDPQQENRGADDVPLLGPQQFEIRNMLCPNDNMATYKFKQAVVDPINRQEVGQVEYSIRIDLDP